MDIVARVEDLLRAIAVVVVDVEDRDPGRTSAIAVSATSYDARIAAHVPGTNVVPPSKE